LKDDFVTNQNEYFKLQKEITLLQREKLALEKKIDSTVLHLDKIEGVIYGKNLFDLDPNTRDLDNISDINLRPELTSSMKNKRTIH